MAILAAVGESSDQSDIVSCGFELATAFDEELFVVHVIPDDEADRHFEAIRDIDEFSDLSIDIEVERAADIASRFVDSAGIESEAGSVTPVGRVGQPTEEILDVASEVDPRYLVVGARKRSPVGKAVFGSVTQAIVLNARRPVVTVPDTV